MENILTKTTKLALYIVIGYIHSGDFVIDATCGNGNDTIVLSRAVGSTGNVLAIDIQQDAVDRTRALLSEYGADNVKVIKCNFNCLGETAKENFGERKPSAIMFNLGYLPGGDKKKTTESADTLTAVKNAVEMIRPNGIVSVAMYSGHEEGAREKKALLEYSETLSSEKFHVVYTNMLNQKNNPPELLLITKK